MNRPRLIRGLRIAWTAGCAILCLLFIGLWVRSYWWTEGLGRARPTDSGISVTLISSEQGTILFGHRNASHGTTYHWTYHAALPKMLVFDSFWWHHNDDEFAVRFPIWLPLIILAAATVVPWLRLQFSRRTLSISIR